MIDAGFKRLGRADAKEEVAIIPFLAAGPVSLLATLSLALQGGANYDLAVAAAAGLFLSFSLRMRGFFYSLALLTLGAIPKHLLFLDSHLWQMGVEVSLSIGYAICALSSELFHARESSLEARLESQGRAIGNFEEEASRSRQEALQEKIALQSRLAELQKELDEAEAEMASLRILNDVVRKSSLKKEEDTAKIAEKERRIAELLGEIEQLMESRPTDASLLKEENERLLQELNAARVEREQTCLINETLARMHAAADRKAREQTRETERLQEQMEALLQSQSEREALLHEARMKMTAAVEIERREWSEQLSERDRTITLFQERIRALSETQALYFQLKKQFDEKNEVLHQTRQELFRAETALQAAQIDQKWEEVEFPLFESMLASEVALLEDEKRLLEGENRELSEIIGILSEPLKAAPIAAQKKSKLSRRKAIY